MKKGKLILFIVGVLISFIGTSQIPLQEVPMYYYDVTKTFNENGYSYQCDKASYGIVTLYNKANQYTYSPYENKDGSSLGNLDNLLPFIEPDNWTRQKCFSIVNDAFSPNEKQRVKGTKVDVSMTVNTSTGKVFEVDFRFYYSNPVATIPVSTYRNLELALKSQIWFSLTNSGKKLKFVQIGWMHEIE